MARINRASGAVSAVCGADVETGDGFLVEGTWPGVFEAAGFHKSPHFFGSGLRIDGDTVWLVPSSALVDRLLLFIGPEEVVASNSLALLLAETGGKFPRGSDFAIESFTSLRGINEYRPSLRIPVEGGFEYRQVFHKLVRIADGTVTEVSRPETEDSLQTVEDYVAALSREIDAIGANATSAARKRRLQFYSTISAGYDSATTTAITAHLGLRAAYTSEASNSTLPSWLNRLAAIDDGGPIARTLGVPVRTLRREPPGLAELSFLAVTKAESEAVFASLVEDLRSDSHPALLFTGYHGDKIWERTIGARYLTNQLIRGDTSGLNLSEVRLDAGFINVPVPFLFATRVAEINRISRDASMAQWSIGGDYDRPIPRRILEDRGVPRDAFGTRKRAVIQTYLVPRDPTRRQQYLTWLEKEYGISHAGLTLRRFLLWSRFLFVRPVDLVCQVLRVPFKPDYASRRILGVDLAAAIHEWALEQRTAELKQALTVDRDAS